MDFFEKTPFPKDPFFRTRKQRVSGGEKFSARFSPPTTTVPWGPSKITLNFAISKFVSHSIRIPRQFWLHAFIAANFTGVIFFAANSPAKCCRNPRGIFPNKVPGEFCGGFFGGFFRAFFFGKNRRKKSTKKSTAKFKSEFESFAAKIHTARIRPWQNVSPAPIFRRRRFSPAPFFRQQQFSLRWPFTLSSKTPTQPCCFLFSKWQAKQPQATRMHPVVTGEKSHFYSLIMTITIVMACQPPIPTSKFCSLDFSPVFRSAGWLP